MNPIRSLVPLLRLMLTAMLDMLVWSLERKWQLLQCASLSKTVGTAFAIEYLKSKGIDFVSTVVNDLLLQLNSSWRVSVAPETYLPTEAASRVMLPMLVNHTALGMHYVYGFPITATVPTCADILNCSPVTLENKYQPLFPARLPGQSFSYSGGGFIVLQYIIELMEGVSVDIASQEFLAKCDLERDSSSLTTAFPALLMVSLQSNLHTAMMLMVVQYHSCSFHHLQSVHYVLLQL